MSKALEAISPDFKELPLSQTDAEAQSESPGGSKPPRPLMRGLGQ